MLYDYHIMGNFKVEIFLEPLKKYLSKVLFCIDGNSCECELNSVSIKMATTHMDIETVVRGYHIYKEIWNATLEGGIDLQVRNILFTIGLLLA